MLVRPGTSSDGAGVRALFHQLTDRDRYTRFFRKVRGLSDRDVQRLCKLNFHNEVAFVAAAGERENPQIVAQACYFTDPGTNLADIEKMIRLARVSVEHNGSTVRVTMLFLKTQNRPQGPVR